MARHEVEFLWFRDCANHEAALQMLEDVVRELAPGTPIKSIDATDPTVAAAHGFPGSPTIRIDGRDVDPSFQDPAAGTTTPVVGVVDVPGASAAGGWPGLPPCAAAGPATR